MEPHDNGKHHAKRRESQALCNGVQVAKNLQHEGLEEIHVVMLPVEEQEHLDEVEGESSQSWKAPRKG